MCIYIQDVYQKILSILLLLFFFFLQGFNCFDKSGLTWRIDLPAIKDIYLPFDIHIRYYEVTPGNHQ